MKVKLKNLKLSEIIDSKYLEKITELNIGKSYTVINEYNDCYLIDLRTSFKGSMMFPIEWFEEVKELLTDEEKEMLISYFNLIGKKRVKKVERHNICSLLIYTSNNCGKIIGIETDMYKNLTLKKEYTLEELGL